MLSNFCISSMFLILSIDGATSKKKWKGGGYKEKRDLVDGKSLPPSVSYMCQHL